jgi:hypothetical protein
MTVLARRIITVKTKEGKVIELTEQDQVSENVDVTVACDNAKCESRNGKKTTVAWSADEVKANPDGLPDAFYRLLTLIVDSKTNRQLVFCSPGCVKDYLTYEYVVPLSPREQAVQAANNAKADAANNRLNVVSFPTPDQMAAAQDEALKSMSDVKMIPVAPEPEVV